MLASACSYLFSSDFHVVGDIWEYSWFNEVSNVAPAFAAALQFGTLTLAWFNVSQNALENLIIDLRALHCVAVEWIADGALTS